MRKTAFACLIALVIALGAKAQGQAQAAFDNEIKVLVNKLGSKLNHVPDIRSIAIADFTNVDGTATDVDKVITDKFLTSMVDFNGSFVVVDRSRINSLLKEAGLSAKGLLDGEHATKLGKLKSIDVIVVGMVTPDGNDLSLTIKAIYLESGVVAAHADGEITRTATIKQLESPSDERGGDKPRTQTKLSGEKDGLTAEISACKQTGTDIECLMTITSKQQDGNLSMYLTKSKIIDANDGAEFKMSHVILGNISTEEYYIQKNLVADHPLVVRCTFSPATRRVTKIARLDITLGDFKVLSVRDIPVEQQ